MPLNVRDMIGKLMSDQRAEAELPVSRALAEYEEVRLGEQIMPEEVSETEPPQSEPVPVDELETDDIELPEPPVVPVPDTGEFEIPEFGGEPEVIDLPDLHPHTGLGGAEWDQDEPDYMREMLNEFAEESAKDSSERMMSLYADMRVEFMATLDDELSMLDRGNSIL